jgi:predicted DNA-binding transcriptional regulator AlpA
MSTKLIDRTGLALKGINWNASTLWPKTVKCEFPKPVLVGNKNFWVEAEVDEYIANLIAARDTKTLETA